VEINYNVQDYILSLTQAFPSIKEIWLFGSRANDTFKDSSDWDLLVFADEEVFNALQSCSSFNENYIDLLINYRGDDFTSPWGDPPKSGNLKTWEWEKITETDAVYTEAKCIDNTECSQEFNADFIYTKLTRRNAIRLWPLANREGT
jgi:predicted nucleotidyltransferase